MSKVSEQDSGVVGGTMDDSRDTNIREPSHVIDAALSRRREAEERGKQALRRLRALARQARQDQHGALASGRSAQTRHH